MIIGFIIAAAVVLLDQITKIIANHFLTQGVTVGSGLIRFDLYYNSGAGFSMLEDYPIILTLLSLVASIFLGYAIYKYANFKNKKVLTIGLAFILGGCFGNLIDRFLTTIGVYKGVIDFIEIWFGNHLFLNTTENLADIFLVIGVIMLFVQFLILDEIEKKKTESKVEVNKNEENSSK